MAFTPVALAQAQLTNTGGTLYTVPASTTIIVREIFAVNTSGSAQTVSISLVPTGGSQASTNRIVDAYSINAHTHYQWSCWQVLDAGDFIYAIANANTAITVTISGMALT
jgi:hypothetical protein